MYKVNRIVSAVRGWCAGSENPIAHGCQKIKDVTKMSFFDRFDVCILEN